ncbi:hypothetical protein [Streptomyces sp. NPDC101455]|uniref:hypothetical protein n=1 Tax=Streptomyces sp. NPDC101455 TaxID=3366142 RepID=UPI003828013D
MLPGFLTKAMNLLLAREGRSLHLKTAGAATAVLVVVMLVGITTYGLVTAALATWFVGREQTRHHHLVRSAERDLHEAYDETAHALHERFDRLDRLLTTKGEPKGEVKGGPRDETK